MNEKKNGLCVLEIILIVDTYLFEITFVYRKSIAEGGALNHRS